MKKLILLLFLCIACIWMTHRNHQGKKYSLLLENIEALAGGEEDIVYRCLGLGAVDCPSDHSKVKYVVSGGYR